MLHQFLPRRRLLLLHLLLLLLVLHSFAYASPPGLDAFFSTSALHDPLAANDSFPSLPSPLASSLSSSLAPLRLLPLHTSVPLTLHLLGPFSSSAPATLLSLVSAALSSSPSPFHSLSSPHSFSLSHSLRLDPSLHSSPLSAAISSSITSHLDSSTSPFLPTALRSVPYSLVDRIIREDYVRVSSSSAPAYHLYILNLDPQSRPYAYSYSDRDASPGYAKCLGSLWAGTERYAWIDLAAGPLHYGPSSGDGLLPRGDFHPLSALHRGPRQERALLADVATLVLGAYRTLLAPSLQMPVFFEPALLVQFVHIYTDVRGSTTGLDFGLIEQTIKESGLPFKHQPLRFVSYSVKYSDCAICAFAISRASSSYTTRYHFVNYTLFVDEYLDSKLLHQLLLESVDEVRRSAGITEELEQFGKVLPVYVFDLNFDKHLLLDRFHQAVAFRDMVIAVRTRISQNPRSDYSCNGQNVIVHTRNLDRSIVGSVLQSTWGVAPTHFSWSPQHNSTLVDYTWSMGQTPFGPFSESLTLSFAQKDAARRNVLLTTLNYTITSTVDVVESMAAHGGDRKLLEGNRHVEFVQRWNLLKYKLEKVVSAMSQLDFDKALSFLKSSDHDLYAIHTLVYEATQELEASLVCFKDPPFPWALALMSGVVLFGLFYCYAKRAQIFKNKRKQF